MNKCENIGLCGGCTFRELSYQQQIEYKENKVRISLSQYFDVDTEFQTIVPSPLTTAYRNKMELSFGDDKKDGPLNLGMHQKRSFYNILNADNCDLISDEMKEVVSKTLLFFREKGIRYFHRRTFRGYLRYLVLRKSYYENKLLVNLVTSSDLSYRDEVINYSSEINDCRGEVPKSQIVGANACRALTPMDENQLLSEYVEYIKNDYIAGIIHTINNQVSDAVKCDDMKLLYGVDYLTEKVCDIYFRISPFSFFQTNSLCAEKLYLKAKEFALSDNGCKDKVLYDLFCGTGTIAQIMSKDFKKVIGVEIVSEAVEKAKENAELNNIINVEFLCEDVNKFIDTVCMSEDNILILDPPREGIIEKTLNKILSMKPQTLVYISCKLQSLERDAALILQAGYKLKKVCPVDMFPWTDNVETVALFRLV